MPNIDADRIFDDFAQHLKKFENEGVTKKGSHHLEKAINIYKDISESDHIAETETRFHNLLRTYALSFEMKAKELFNSNKIESADYLNFEFTLNLINIGQLLETNQIFNNDEGEYSRLHLLLLVFALMALPFGNRPPPSIQEVRNNILKHEGP